MGTARLAILAAATLALSAHAVTLYKLVDDVGRVTYSDHVPRGFGGRVVPLEVTDPPVVHLPRADADLGGTPPPDYESVIRQRPPDTGAAEIAVARERLQAAERALLDVQANSRAEDWYYHGRGRGRSPRPEYLARLQAAEAQVAAARTELESLEARR